MRHRNCGGTVEFDPSTPAPNTDWIEAIYRCERCGLIDESEVEDE